MMSELRWALMIVGGVFIGALAWWESRRPRQASGTTQRVPPRESAPETASRVVRDPPLTLPEMHPHEPLPSAELPVLEMEPADPVRTDAADRRAADVRPEVEGRPEADGGPEVDGGPEADGGPEVDGGLEAAGRPETDGEFGADGRFATDDGPGVEAPAAAAPDIVPDGSSPAQEAAPVHTGPPNAPAPGMVRESLPELPAAEPLHVDWPPDDERRILALRLVARQHERFAGRPLRQALAAEGFLLGQFAIFHKPDEARRAVLSAANLTRPGTFDMETMDSQHYGGVSLFAVLPGPRSPYQAFEELMFAARNLNERLQGVLQDEQGVPLTPARIAQLREQLRAESAS